MRIDEQLREMARHADQHQRVITAAEVVQRASGRDRPPLAAPTKLDKASAADTDDGDGDIIMLGTQDPRNSEPTTPRRRSPGRWLLVAAAVAMVAVVGTVLVAVSGDDDKPLHTATPPTAAPLERACPFTAEEVSEIIGETVTGPESSTECNFGQSWPSVHFDYRPPSACTPESRADQADNAPPVEAVDGLGVEAYSQRVSVGVSLLVCDGDQTFTVFADGIQGDPLAADIALARLVLSG